MGHSANSAMGQKFGSQRDLNGYLGIENWLPERSLGTSVKASPYLFGLGVASTIRFNHNWPALGW